MKGARQRAEGPAFDDGVAQVRGVAVDVKTDEFRALGLAQTIEPGERLREQSARVQPVSAEFAHHVKPQSVRLLGGRQCRKRGRQVPRGNHVAQRVRVDQLHAQAWAMALPVRYALLH